MSNREEIIKTIGEVIEAGDKLIKASKELIACGEILLNAIKGFQTVLGKEEATDEPSAIPDKKEFTKEEVRAVLSAKSAAGFGKEVKALLLKHGAAKLSDLKTENYEAVITDAKEIGNE